MVLVVFAVAGCSGSRSTNDRALVAQVSPRASDFGRGWFRSVQTHVTCGRDVLACGAYGFNPSPKAPQQAIATIQVLGNASEADGKLAHATAHSLIGATSTTRVGAGARAVTTSFRIIAFRRLQLDGTTILSTTAILHARSGGFSRTIGPYDFFVFTAGRLLVGVDFYGQGRRIERPVLKRILARAVRSSTH